MIKTIKEHLGISLICLIEIIVGFLLLFDPVRFTSGIIIAIGVLLVMLGISSLIRYFSSEPKQAAKEQNMAKGLFLLGTGIFCVLRHNWFLLTFPALTVLYSAGLMFIGFFKTQRAVDMLRLKWKMWYIAAINAALSLLICAIILVNPFKSTTFVWILIGGTLLLSAAADLITLFYKENTKG